MLLAVHVSDLAVAIILSSSAFFNCFHYLKNILKIVVDSFSTGDKASFASTVFPDNQMHMPVWTNVAVHSLNELLKNVCPFFFFKKKKKNKDNNTIHSFVRYCKNGLCCRIISTGVSGENSGYSPN